MKKLKDMTIIDFLTITSNELRAALNQQVKAHGKECWLLEPEIKEGKPCLVAHIDMVHKEPKDKLLIHDKEQELIYSPDGLGADDRAGVYGILKLFYSMPESVRPYVLLTDYEETGASGALEACTQFPQLEKALCFIELDRESSKDCVFYNHDQQDFKSYIEGFGFKESWGSFSDISIVGKHFSLCSVNLSIGYYSQHTKQEILSTYEMNKTIEKTREMITDIVKSGEKWVLIPEVSKDSFAMYADEKIYMCDGCGADIFEDELSGDTCPFCLSQIEEAMIDQYWAEEEEKAKGLDDFFVNPDDEFDFPVYRETEKIPL